MGEQGRGIWVHGRRGPLAGWLHEPPVGSTGVGVVMLPPFGYEYLVSHHTCLRLADTLAAHGHLVLRLDYGSTADSSGDVDDVRDVDDWVDDARSAMSYLAAYAEAGVVAVGLRFGAEIALRAARAPASFGVPGIVAWLPTGAPGRYRRELLMSATASPDDPSLVALHGTLCRTGFLDSFAALDPVESSPTPLLVIDDPARSSRWERYSSHATVEALPGAQDFVFTAAESARVNEGHVDAVVHWIDTLPRAAVHRPETSAVAVVAHGSRTVVERFVQWGGGLAGIHTTPIDGGHRSGGTVVFLNSGSEKHIGPGRRWVELARELAGEHGLQVLRVDYRGMGESVDALSGPLPPYDDTLPAAADEVIEAVRQHATGPLVAVGSCSSAYHLAACSTEQIDGAVLFNPQLWYSDELPGDLPETPSAIAALLTSVLADPSSAATADRTGRRLVRHLATHEWSADVWFSADDPGIRFIEARISDELAAASARVCVEVNPNLDHAMNLAWFRGEAVSAILTALERARTRERAGYRVDDAALA